MNHLVLWDIDGTLMHGGGVSAEALHAGMERAFGPLSNQLGSLAGKTDQQIMLESYLDHDHTGLEAAMAQFTPVYLEELAARRDRFAEKATLLPGARETLERLHTSPDVLQSVLTGNIAPAAAFKLEIFGLDRFLDLSVGAYGSDHHHRPELVPYALRRVQQRFGHMLEGRHVVVIGDTPNDIACGQAVGARTIGVATGPYSVADLRAAGADTAFETLVNTDKVIAAILA